MKTKKVICCIGVFLLVVCAVYGATYAAQRDQMKNDVFTDVFFENMTGISPGGVPDAMLEGPDAADLVSYLKGLRLVLIEDNSSADMPLSELSDDQIADILANMPRSEEILVGGNWGYCIYYQGGKPISFDISDATLEIQSKTYLIVDKDGKPAEECGDVVWHFFHPELPW